MKDCRKIGFEIFRALVDARDVHATYCTEMRFASFFSGGFITAIVVNPPERKLAKHTSVHYILILSLFEIEKLGKFENWNNKKHKIEVF